MAAQRPRAERHSGLEPDRHLLSHDDEMDELERKMASMEQRHRDDIKAMRNDVTQIKWAAFATALAAALAFGDAIFNVTSRLGQ